MNNNNFAADRETQAQAFTFRRVKRIEESLPARGGDADTCISDRDSDITVRDF